MDSRQAMRDRTIVEWYFQDWIGDTSHLPEPEDVLTFMKIVVDVISMNRSLSEPERNYLIGRAAILGVPVDLLENLRAYQPNPTRDLADLDLPHVRKTRMGIIYNLFRMFGGDRTITPKEMKLIYMFGKQLDVSDEQLVQLQSLYEEEEKLRKRRAALLFPHGFNDALTEYQKLH